MASTTIRIPGVQDIVIQQFAMNDVAAVRSYLNADYPQIGNMQDNLVTDPATGNVTVTFSQRAGNKG